MIKLGTLPDGKIVVLHHVFTVPEHYDHKQTMNFLKLVQDLSDHQGPVFLRSLDGKEWLQDEW